MKNPHRRHRKFNTRDTYPAQNLDNDLCQVVLARGTQVFVRGQVGQEIDGFESVGDADAGAQAEQAMRNLLQLLREVGAAPQHVCRIQVYIVERADRDAVYRVIGKYLRGVFPVSTGLIVRGLARPEWLMEIEATAVIPDINETVGGVNETDDSTETVGGVNETDDSTETVGGVNGNADDINETVAGVNRNGGGVNETIGGINGNAP